MSEAEEKLIAAAIEWRNRRWSIGGTTYTTEAREAEYLKADEKLMAAVNRFQPKRGDEV